MPKLGSAISQLTNFGPFPEDDVRGSIRCGRRGRCPELPSQTHSGLGRRYHMRSSITYWSTTRGGRPAVTCEAAVG